MAYATGSGSNTQAFMQALRDFAFGQGWTIAKWDIPNLLLFMSKGQCFASMQGITGLSLNDFNNPPSNAATDAAIYGCLGTSLNGALTNYWSQPGSTMTGQTDNSRVNCNDLVGPFTSWHFFSGNTGAGDPDYIHCAIQSAADRWTHISIGNIDKGSYTHSGVGYFTGMWYYFTRFEAGGPGNNNSYNWPAMAIPTSGHSLIFGGTNGQSGRGALTYYAPNATPAGGGFATMGTVNRGNVGKSFRGNTPADAISGTTETNGFCDRVVLSGPTPVGQRTPLFAIPLFLYSTTGPAYLHVGDYPNVRFVNLTGLVAGQEISYSADTWKVFPLKRQTAWGSLKTVQECTSGQYGVAYKKIA